MENNILVVKDENGVDVELEVIDILDATYNEEPKEYIVYKVAGNDDMIISALNERGDTYSIEDIESEEEYNYIQEAIKDNIVGDNNE